MMRDLQHRDVKIQYIFGALSPPPRSCASGLRRFVLRCFYFYFLPFESPVDHRSRASGVRNFSIENRVSSGPNTTRDLRETKFRLVTNSLTPPPPPPFPLHMPSTLQVETMMGIAFHLFVIILCVSSLVAKPRLFVVGARWVLDGAMRVSSMMKLLIHRKYQQEMVRI